MDSPKTPTPPSSPPASFADLVTSLENLLLQADIPLSASPTPSTPPSTSSSPMQKRPRSPSDPPDGGTTNADKLVQLIEVLTKEAEDTRAARIEKVREMLLKDKMMLRMVQKQMQRRMRFLGTSKRRRSLTGTDSGETSGSSVEVVDDNDLIRSLCDLLLNVKEGKEKDKEKS